MKTVLVVDDEDINRKVFTEFLSLTYKVITAKNGAEAVEKLKANSIDCVLMDVQMPIMDGVEALKKIRETHPSKPVIMMSAYGASNEYKQGMTLMRVLLDAGLTDFVEKPVSPLSYLNEVIDKYTK